MNKLIIICIIFLNVACSNYNEKGKKGDFLFRKCAKCGINEENAETN
ncbi:MAG: hypothetical protein CFH21_00655 [Alphaproteobacteria bacterium MarineAlpha5_Bin11]|nr:MAG: hypothetical protein CFH21_00655 [Alphaproteobacteria bacterium MarineAlpha5_Bin11]PPR51327.1 MAG: hypothetical protein CFH20_00642 [Alphaproteobacteria bacterium MarineAlpha5_Bin10]|tara:strand:- start:278 stop:418 length:141 start_codon:yes stop_codon:yes gene_type:complete